MSYASEVLADAPAIYWRCNDASGQLADSSGNARPTTSFAGSGVTYSQSSPITSDAAAKSIRLVGTGNFVRTDASGGVDLGNVVSLEAWFRRGTTGAAQGILSKGLGAYFLGFTSGDLLELAADGDFALVNSDVTVTDTALWHHVVATKNGTGTGTLHLYFDGADHSSVVFDEGDLIDNATNLAIGDSAFTGSPYNGYLAELALYTTVLSAARVAAHYAAATAGGGGAGGSTATMLTMGVG